MASSKKRRVPISAFMLATQLDSNHFQHRANSIDATIDGNGEYALQRDYNGWSDDELKSLSNINDFTDTILNKLESNLLESLVTTCYGICHDSDECDVWDPTKHVYVREHVPAHDHIFVAFASRALGATVDEIAEAIGLPPNMIEKPKKGRYSTDNMQAYLVHAKNADKHQYSPEEVYTARGIDYVDLYNHRKKDWDKGRAVKNNQRDKADAHWLIDKARFGQVTLDEIMSISEFYEIYSDPSNTTRIDNALNTWANKRMFDAKKALDNNDYATMTIYVHGKAGQGKTTLVKGLVKVLNKLYGWDVARLAGSNALDDYKGEDIVWLDDVSNKALPTVDDWLKFMDPHNANAQSARYKNKAPLAPHVIIITSNQDPLDFIYFMKGIGGGNRNDKIDAFFRRIGLVLFSVSSLDTIVQDYSAYDGPNFKVFAPLHLEDGVIDTIDDNLPYSTSLYHHNTFSPIHYDESRDDYSQLVGTDWMKSADDEAYVLHGGTKYYMNNHRPSSDEIMNSYEVGFIIASNIASSMNKTLSDPDDVIEVQKAIYEAFEPAVKKGIFHALPDPNVIYRRPSNKCIKALEEVTYELPEEDVSYVPSVESEVDGS